MPSKTIHATIVSIGDEQVVKTARGGYKKFEVAFKSDGKIQGKTLVDYSNPEVYAAARALEQGQTVSVTIEKQAAADGKEYWNWVSIGDSGPVPEGQVSAPAVRTESPKPTGRAGGNWETAEERAARQVYIIRQSSITAALAYLNARDSGVRSLGEVLSVAETFKEYALNGLSAEQTAAGAVAQKKTTRSKKSADEFEPEDYSLPEND